MRVAFAKGICARSRFSSLADKEGYIKLGPIPKNTPVNLIANLSPISASSSSLQAKLVPALMKIHTQESFGRSGDGRNCCKTIPELLAANKCPDFVEDKGHYFGTDLADNDKRALIEYLKTL